MQGLFEAGFHCQSEWENLISINPPLAIHDWNPERGVSIGGYIHQKEKFNSNWQWPKSVLFFKDQVCDYTDYIGTTFQFRPGTVEVVKVGVNNKNTKKDRCLTLSIYIVYDKFM